MPRPSWRHAVLLAGSTVALLPLLALVARALLDLPAVWGALGDVRLWAAWRASVGLALGAAGLGLLAALVLAVLSVRTNLPGARALGLLCRLPLALPGYLLAMAHLRLYAPRAGLLDHLVGWSWDPASPLGCALLLALTELPILYLPVEAALRRADPATEEAARMCGASPLRALWDASVRPALPTAAVAASLAAASALAAFGVPLLLGTSGRTPFSVLTTTIYEQLLVGTPDAWNRAVAAAGLLLMTSLGLSLLGAWFSRKVPPASQGKPSRPRVLGLGTARVPLAVLLWGGLGAALLAPMVALTLASIQPFAGAPPAQWSLQAHAALWARPGLLEATMRSVVLASGAATACLLVALVLGAWRHRRNVPLAREAGVVAALPYALPGSILAMGMLLAFSRPLRFILLEQVTVTVLLGSTAWMLLLAYALKHAALAVRPLDVALKGQGPVLEEAARMAGAGPQRAFVTGSIMPLRATLVSSWVGVALLCFSELTLSVLLVGPGTAVVGTVLFELHSYASPAESAALATWMVGVAVLGFSMTATRRPA
jgi:iron(III) transport system permease protein